MAELKPVHCGCGGEAKVYETPLKDCEGYFVQCNDCRIATFIWLSEAEAITAWNKAMGAKDINVLTKERTAKVVSFEEDDYCGSCNAEFIGKPNYCPSCGARLEWK